MPPDYPKWLFKQTRIFHMTAIDNLPKIFASGGLLAKNMLSRNNVDYTNVAYEDIQDVWHRITLLNGNNLHDYVPFHFAPRSPMLFAIADGIIANCTTKQEDMIYFVSYVENFTNDDFIFCDHHPIMQPTVAWYNNLSDLNQLDWDIFFERPRLGEYAQFWQDRSDNVRWANRKSKRQAEFLIYNKVDLTNIVGFAVMNEKIKQKLGVLCTEFGIGLPTVIKKEWYK
jgi:hypothetical protein